MKFKTLFIFLLILSFGKATEYYQATTLINIRSGHGKDFSIVGSIAKGDSVVIDSIISEWGQVIINDKLKGYASMEFLTSEFEYYPVKSKTVIPPTSHQQAAEPADKSYWKWILTTGCIICICLYIITKRKRFHIKSIKEEEHTEETNDYEPSYYQPTSTLVSKVKKEESIYSHSEKKITPIVKKEEPKYVRPEKKIEPKAIYYCEICGDNFRSVKDLAWNACLRSDTKKHSLYEGKEKSEYFCKYCGTSFRNLKSMCFNRCFKNPNGKYHRPAL